MDAADLECAFVGMGAAGSGLAIETALRGARIKSWFDPNPAIAEAVGFRGGLAYEGVIGAGAVAMPAASANPAEAVRGADIVFVSSTADKHAEVAAAIAPGLREGQVVVLHCGYVGGSKVFSDALSRAGGAGAKLFELNNTLHLCGKVDPFTLSVRGTKRWLEIAGSAGDAEDPRFQAMMRLFGEFEFSDNVLENGLNNPNCIGHVPAYVGGSVLLDRDLGEMTTGILHFHESRMGRVNILCAELEAERDRLMRRMGLTPLPSREFDRRAYPAGTRANGGIARFGPKLQKRFVHEDVPCALVPMECLGRQFGIETPIISSLITLANVLEGVDFRKSGRGIETLAPEWVKKHCPAA